MTHAQLLDTGFTRHAIAHRLRKGRLHRIWRGVYAVGRPELSALGRYMAAVLSCGPSAVLSHDSAAALWELRRQRRREVDVSMPSPLHPRRPGIVIHRRTGLTARGVTVHRGIPVTTPVCTLVDLATRLDREELEAAVNEADRLDLADPETVRTAIDATASRGGVRALRVTLDLRTFTLTDSALERRFLRLARGAGLPRPEAGRELNGYRVDFYWPELDLVVETDGLRYHRTPTQQGRDRLRDQAHVVAGLTCLRFTHAQVTRDPGHVQATLMEVTRALRGQHGE